MAVSQRIKDLGQLVEDYAPNMPTYTLLAFLSALDDFIKVEVDAAVFNAERSKADDPANLALVIGNSDVIQALIVHSQKIQAIKETRSRAGCGLRAAKDAVEAFVVPFGFPGTYKDNGNNIRWDYTGSVVTDNNRPHVEPPF